MRMMLTTLALCALALPAAAQEHAAHAAGGRLPEGWQGRVDRANQNIAEVQVMAMGADFHIKTGPHVILWNPQTTATGAYRASVTFTQPKTPERAEGFGFLVGGRALQQDTQDYLYFLIRHDGNYLIRHRAGSEVHTLVNWTASDAIRKPGASTAASNTLAIESTADQVRFLINGTAVQTYDRVPMMNTDGIVGLRVGHHLEVHASPIRVEPVAK